MTCALRNAHKKRKRETERLTNKTNQNKVNEFREGQTFPFHRILFRRFHSDSTNLILIEIISILLYHVCHILFNLIACGVDRICNLKWFKSFFCMELGFCCFFFHFTTTTTHSQHYIHHSTSKWNAIQMFIKLKPEKYLNCLYFIEIFLVHKNTYALTRAQPRSLFHFDVIAVK